MDVATPTTDTTPVTSTDAVPAAPATSAPTSTEPTSQRPTSFRDAFEQVAAANPDDPTALGSAAATAQPVDPTNAANTPAPKGEPPQEKWPQILENARTKATADVKQQFEQQYPGLSAIDPQTYSGWRDTAREMHADPIGWTEKWLAQLGANPTYGPQLRSNAGRILAAGRGAQADPEPQPDVEIVNQAGQVTGLTYSAKAQAEREAWHGRKLLAQVQQELQPIKAEREQAQATAHAAESLKQATAQADTVMGRVDAILDGDKAMYAHMDALMAADPRLDAVDAALQVRKTHIVPTLEQRATQKALDLNKQKAAGTTANGTGVAATPTRPRTRQELAAHLAALHGG